MKLKGKIVFDKVKPQTCENCGHDKLRHELLVFHCNGCSKCRKFKPSHNQKAKGLSRRPENRLTVVDEKGNRIYERFDLEIDESIQDNGRTLKIFIRPKKKEVVGG